MALQVSWAQLEIPDQPFVTPGRGIPRQLAKRKGESEEEKLKRRIEQGIIPKPPEPAKPEEQITVEAKAPTEAEKQASALIDAIAATRAANIVTEQRIAQFKAKQEAKKVADAAKAVAEAERARLAAEQAQRESDARDMEYVHAELSRISKESAAEHEQSVSILAEAVALNKKADDAEKAAQKLTALAAEQQQAAEEFRRQSKAVMMSAMMRMH